MEEQITEIMAEFDFDTVQRVMDALGWQWANDGYGAQVPHVRRLQARARELLDAVAQGQSWRMATGGLVAERADDGTLSLAFQLCYAEGVA